MESTGLCVGPLLFLIYINELYKSIKHCTVRHFADDTNLLISNNSPKQLQSYLNSDLKNLCKWLRSNKICLNYEFKIKMKGKKLYSSKFVKYLGVLIY